MTNNSSNNETTIAVTEDIKLKALADYLKVEPELVSASSYDTYECQGEEWLVLDDDEADERAREHILETLWAFRASFIASWVDYEGPNKPFIESLELIQSKQCESANPIIKAMLGSKLDAFIEDAINADGRGHFLSSWDGEEIELPGNLYAYRIN